MLSDAAYQHHLKIPHAEPGMRIGLFGGSFNPPHEGHMLVSEYALVRAKLDQVWWLVTPGNPLKENDNLPPLRHRIQQCISLNSRRNIKITGVEKRFETRFTYDILAKLVARRPNLKFVWLMGADNLATFHLWRDWRKIAHLMPILVIDRPGSTLSVTSAPGAYFLRNNRLPPEYARLIASKETPAWTFLHGPRSAQSSTALRKLEISG